MEPQSVSSSPRSWASPLPQAPRIRWAAEMAASPSDSTPSATSIHSIAEHALEAPEQAHHQL